MILFVCLLFWSSAGILTYLDCGHDEKYHNSVEFKGYPKAKYPERKHEKK